MIFTAPVPQHHLFKGSTPIEVKKKKPFAIEHGKQEIYTAYTLKYEKFEIEIWTDGKNFWINKE